jgi:hypothetical protein
MRNKAIDAVDLLNDFIGDLITGANVLREYMKEQREGRLDVRLMVPIQRMCLSHLILTLNKWCEFYEKYSQLVADEHREAVKGLNRELKDKKVKEFRHKCIGHIWDKEHRRPLIHSEIMTRLENITGGSLPCFLSWINNPQNNTSPNTVVSIVETVRDSISARYQITEAEVIGR